MKKFIHIIEAMEPNTGPDRVEMSLPLFIRCLEWAKETAEDDVQLHKLSEIIIEQNRFLDTDDYSMLVGGIHE